MKNILGKGTDGSIGLHLTEMLGAKRYIVNDLMEII